MILQCALGGEIRQVEKARQRLTRVVAIKWGLSSKNSSPDPCLSAPDGSGALRLEGCENFRDLGGLPAAEGRYVARGRVYRSSELSRLTAADLETLKRLEIRHVFDLRGDAERAICRSRLPEDSPIHVHLWPLLNGAGVDPVKALEQELAGGLNPERLDRALGGLMVSMALGQGHRLGALYREIAGGAWPCVIHCAAGKDRTGLAVAILLSLLGVARQRVLEDYLKSNAAPRPPLESLPPGLSRLPEPVFELLMSVRAAWLEGVFEAITARHGSVEEYSLEVLGLSIQELGDLREALLEPANS
jgi:protein-tyrosine phosphatase